MTAHVVIAVRGGPDAKSRCRDRLSEPERDALVEAMLADMLDALSGPAIHTHVATPSPALARLAAARPGVTVLAEPPGGGLNGAFEAARRHIAALDPDAPVAFMPGDLPLLDAAELEAALAAMAPGAVGLVQAMTDGGTGAVILAAGTPFGFAFGPDSFRRHLAAAASAGLAPLTLSAPSLAFDIDGPEDLDRLIAGGHDGATARLLRGLAQRAEAALPGRR